MHIRFIGLLMHDFLFMDTNNLTVSTYFAIFSYE